jgi:serine/threonine-protein kinase
MVGRRIGPYRLVEYVASGGMCAVYRAERADREFEQQVAIKLVNRWMVTPLVRQRFQRERQTLANLEHPGITRLLDGGTTEDGIPYLVMEYVAGLPIDDYCAQRGLSIADRLGLFREVCEVVAHAHRNLVVHRDLKPGNILVTEDGRPLLLDFGIAKLLELAPEAGAARTTLQQLRALTPQYASPEQIRGEPVTTAADVYSLGVVLYQLLTGRRPYRLTGRSTYDDERTVCETEPRLPSDAVTGGADDAEDDGRDRRLPEPPARLRHRLRGDLDAIVMTAMEKQPAERYESVSALADDIARYLNGQPVRARHHFMSYRAAKFVRRNIFAVGAAAIVAISVVGGGVAASIGLVREARAHRLAHEEATEAEAINRFLNEMLSSVDPGRDGRDVRVAEILDRAAQDVGSRFGDRPEVQAALRTTIGRCYRALGMLEPAAVHLESALELREALRGAEHRETVESLNELAILRIMQGDLSTAEELLEDALASARRQLDRRDELLLSILSSLAGLRNVQARLPEAEELLRELLDVQHRTLAETHPDTIRTIHNLALVLRAGGNVLPPRARVAPAGARARPHPHHSHPGQPGVPADGARRAGGGRAAGTGHARGLPATAGGPAPGNDQRSSQRGRPAPISGQARSRAAAGPRRAGGGRGLSAARPSQDRALPRSRGHMPDGARPIRGGGAGASGRSGRAAGASGRPPPLYAEIRRQPDPALRAVGQAGAGGPVEGTSGAG